MLCVIDTTRNWKYRHFCTMSQRINHQTFQNNQEILVHAKITYTKLLHPSRKFPARIEERPIIPNKCHNTTLIQNQNILSNNYNVILIHTSSYLRTTLSTSVLLTVTRSGCTIFNWLYNNDRSSFDTDRHWLGSTSRTRATWSRNKPNVAITMQRRSKSCSPYSLFVR